MTIAEYLRSISFEDIEEILWEVYGMGDNFTPFIKMTYDRICHQTGTSEHSYMIVQIVNFSIDPLGMNVIMPGGCVISLWRTLFYVIYCIILEVS